MSHRTLLDADPETGVVEWHHHDPMSGEWAIETVQDCTPIIELNKAEQRHYGGGAMGMNEGFRIGAKEGWMRVGRIPNVIIDKWRREYGVDVFKWGRCEWTTRKIKQMLNSREWMYLRSNEGRI